MSSHRITTLPDTLPHLPSLSHLSIDHNHLTTIPASISALLSLCVLRVSHNALTSIPDEVGACHALVDVDVSHNALTCVPVSLSRLAQLQRINLNKNRCEVTYREYGLCDAVGAWHVTGDTSSSPPHTHHRIDTLPSAILTDCTSLRDIQCHDNPLTMERMRALDGFEQFDARRRAKHDKQVDMKLLNTRFDEGADIEQYDRYATAIHQQRK